MTTIHPGSLNHSCLRSFLAHAHATGLNTQSTVFLGTRYEYLVARTLKRLGFSLIRVGRGGDAGVDLLGEWALPLPTGTSGLSPQLADLKKKSQNYSLHQSPLRVLLQCKRHNRRLTPEFVRELEGAFAGVPASWRADGSTIGFLVSPMEASRGVRDALQRSRMPVGFIALEEGGDHDVMTNTRAGNKGPKSRKSDAPSNDDYMIGRVKQMLWNWRAQEMGLQGIGITWKHLGDAIHGTGNISKELVLTWNGWAVPDVTTAAPAVTAATTPEHYPVLADLPTLTCNTTDNASSSTITTHVESQTKSRETSGPLLQTSSTMATPVKRRGRPRKTKD